MAPEVFRHERYSLKVDVFSFAIICYEMFEGLLVVADPAAHAAEAAGKKQLRPTCALLTALNLKRTVEMRELIHQCWMPAGILRPTFESVTEVLADIRKLKAPPLHRPDNSCLFHVFFPQISADFHLFPADCGRSGRSLSPTQAPLRPAGAPCSTPAHLLLLRVVARQEALREAAVCCSNRAHMTDDKHGGTIVLFSAACGPR